MKITVLKGSPHKNGASNTLAQEFIKGAKEQGHEIVELDCAKMNLNPCLGCSITGKDKDCIQKDDGNILREEITTSDMVVFVTPVYFYDMSAQLKIALDRFHCFYHRLADKNMKSAIIMTACRSDDEVMKYLNDIYIALTKYLNFENVGIIKATGCNVNSIDKDSQFLTEAYNLGKNL